MSKTQERLMGTAWQRRAALQKGQAIILIAVAAIGLIAIMGLAIDGGRLLLLRRDAQNASDAGVMAATFALCTGGTEGQIREAGLNAARQNGFIHSVNDTTVEVIRGSDASPLEGAPSGTCQDCSVQVKINREVPSYFIGLVYGGSLEVTTSAIGSCNTNYQDEASDPDGDGYTQDPPSMGPVFAGGLDCQVKISSSSNVFVGDLHSNGSYHYQGSQPGGDCSDVPANTDELDKSWTFGETTCSSGSDCAAGWGDAKSTDCRYSDFPGVQDEIACGASCKPDTTGNSDGDSADPPKTVPAYWDPDTDTPVYPEEVSGFNIADFAPAGDVALAYNDDANPANDRYFEIDCSDKKFNFWDFYNANGPGIYYANCAVSLSKSSSEPAIVNATIVTPFDIDANFDTASWQGFYPESRIQMHRLAFFATNGKTPDTAECGSGGGKADVFVNSGGSGASFKGTIYAPYGKAKFSTSSTVGDEACIIAYDVEISTSGVEVRCDPGTDPRSSVGVTD